MGNVESSLALPSMADSILYSRFVASDPNENPASKFIFTNGSFGIVSMHKLGFIFKE
jgi:hypothetical protein